jgi:hypothetical protein
MNLKQVIENIILAANLIEKTTNSEAYLDLKDNHPDISSLDDDIKYRLNAVAFYLEDLSTEKKFLDLLDSSEAVPMSEDLYNRAIELTKGMVVDLDEEFEGDFW